MFNAEQYKQRINNLIKQTAKSKSYPDFYNFVPHYNTYYRVLQSMIPENVNSVIDVGCFLGEFCHGIIGYDNIWNIKRYLNIDISEEAIKYAKEFHNDSYPDMNIKGVAEWKVGNALTFDPKENFDIAFFLGMLEHFSLEQVVSVFERYKKYVKYILVSFTMFIMKNYTVEQFLNSTKHLFHQRKRIEYSIYRREEYEKNNKPQTNNHVFILMGNNNATNF